MSNDVLLRLLWDLQLAEPMEVLNKLLAVHEIPPLDRQQMEDLARFAQQHQQRQR